MADDTTNIRIKTDTWKELKELKDEPGKTWDDVMQELLEHSDTGDEDSNGDDSGNTTRAGVVE